MTEGELKPCPFCGGTNAKPDKNDEADFDVTCLDCHAGTIGVGPGATGMESAIAAWNTRTPTATPSDEVVEEFLHELDGWERAYPLSMFPEPDMRKAAELLKAGGMTLDAISASNMRHVVSRIAPKARDAIAALSAIEGEKK